MPAVNLTPAQLDRYLQAMPKKVVKGVVGGQRQVLKKGIALARQASSGTHTARQLAKAGHPYSRRRPNRRYNPARVNVQTGLFRRTWRAEGPTVSASSVDARIVNDSPQADFMTARGTKRMIGRPIAETVERKIAALAEQTIGEAIGRELSRP